MYLWGQPVRAIPHVVFDATFNVGCSRSEGFPTLRSASSPATPRPDLTSCRPSGRILVRGGRGVNSGSRRSLRFMEAEPNEKTVG